MTYMVERRANFKYQNHPVLVMYGRQVTKKDLATLVQQMDSNMDFESAVELVDKLLAQHPDGDTQAVRKILEFEMMEALMESEVRDEQELIVASLVNLMRMDNADPDEVLGDFPENIQEAARSRMQFEDEFAADDYAGDYMVQSDVARIMDSAARLTMMTPPDETYSEWWKSQLSVVADKIDGLADYLEDRYADETDGMDAETFEASRGNRKHQMMTKELSSKIPKLYSQEEVSDPTVVAHYFTPYGRGDWFVIEWDGEDMMYGLADLGYPELGYFSLSELESAYRGGLPLVERDLHWTPVPLSEVQKTRMAAEVHDGESELEQLGENGFQYYATYIYPANAGEEGLENLLSIERLEDGYFRVGEYSYRGNPETSTHGQYAGQWLVDKSSRKLDWDDISSYSKLYEENYATWDDVINDRPSEYLASEEGSAPIQRPMDFGEPVNWTPHDGTPSLRKRQRAEDSKTSANEPVPAADYEFYYRSLLE